MVGHERSFEGASWVRRERERERGKKKKKSLRDIGFLFLQNIIFIILMDFLNKKIITKI